MKRLIEIFKRLFRKKVETVVYKADYKVVEGVEIWDIDTTETHVKYC